MANKQVSGLTVKTDIVGADLVPVYDSEEAGAEKLKQSTFNDLTKVKWNPFTGTLDRPGLVCVGSTFANIVDVGAPESSQHGVISAADFIISVIENGDPPYLYGLNKVGDASSVIYSDPRDAIVILNCSDVGGPVLMEIWIQDNSANGNYVESYVIPQDNMGVCP